MPPYAEDEILAHYYVDTEEIFLDVYGFRQYS
jgi:hypothetical protein